MHPRLLPHNPFLVSPRLEDRLTPAIVSYAAHTLTATVGEGEVLFFSGVSGSPPGAFRINLDSPNGAEIYNSTTKNEFASNLNIKCDQTNQATVTLNTGLHVPGNVTITGAKSTTTIASTARIGKNFTFAGTGAGSDVVRLNSLSSPVGIGGKVTIKLGEGLNTAYLDGGMIGGDLLVTGGSSNDTIRALDDGDLLIGGSFIATLGGGSNSVKAIQPNSMSIGRDFTVQDGPSGSLYTDIDWYNSGGHSTSGDASLTVGHNLTLKVGTSASGGLITNNFTIGGNLTIVNGASVATRNVNTIAGNLSAKLGQGNNYFNANLGGSLHVGVGFTYLGGSAVDNVYLDAFQIGKSLSIDLGGNNTGSNQYLAIGLANSVRSYVNGSISLAGTGMNQFDIRRLYTFGEFKVKTGSGTDVIHLDDIDVAGLTLVDLGAGSDTLQIDCLGSDSVGTLSGAVNFGGIVKLYGQTGEDIFDLSTTGGTLCRFAAKLFVWGGSGSDTFRNYSGNVYYVSGNFEDCEINVGTALL